jgi:hypothetical protein
MFATELFGRVLAAKGDPAAGDRLRAALSMSEQLDSPRSEPIRAMLADLERGV